MVEYVNKAAIERRRLRLQANASANRTVNHEAIKRREARIKAQQQAKASQKQQQKPPHNAAKQALGEDLFSQIFK